VGRVNRLTERRVLRRAADQALALPALDRLAEPPPPHRSTTPGYAPSDWDVHTRTAGARRADDWDTGDSPAASPPPGDYTEQPSTGFWDDRPGSPVNHYTTASTITAYSPTPGVRQSFPVEDRESDSAYGRQAAGDDYAEETRSPAAAAATARPHHQDLSPISPVQRPGLLLTQGTAWSGDYRLRPWYRTRRAAAAFAGVAAAIVAVGILLAAHTPSDRHQQPTIVAPQMN